MQLATINPVTMTSLELVDFINESRKAGEAELRHDHFMAKVPKVLGTEGLPKFRDTYVHPQNGQTYQMYRFPKREACLMAMSYSYELQAKVFDRMTELEELQGRPATPKSYAEALLEAGRIALALEQAEAERDEAIRTKAEIGSRREATAMGTASQAVQRASRLEIELDKSKDYATVKRMQMLYHGQRFNWRLLRDASAEMGITPIDVFDANYGTVKAYHADVWMAAYAVELDAE